MSRDLNSRPGNDRLVIFTERKLSVVKLKHHTASHGTPSVPTCNRSPVLYVGFSRCNRVTKLNSHIHIGRLIKVRSRHSARESPDDDSSNGKAINLNRVPTGGSEGEETSLSPPPPPFPLAPEISKIRSKTTRDVVNNIIIIIIIHAARARARERSTSRILGLIDKASRTMNCL